MTLVTLQMKPDRYNPQHQKFHATPLAPPPVPRPPQTAPTDQLDQLDQLDPRPSPNPTSSQQLDELAKLRPRRRRHAGAVIRDAARLARPCNTRGLGLASYRHDRTQLYTPPRFRASMLHPATATAARPAAGPSRPPTPTARFARREWAEGANNNSYTPRATSSRTNVMANKI